MKQPGILFLFHIISILHRLTAYAVVALGEPTDAQTPTHRFSFETKFPGGGGVANYGLTGRSNRFGGIIE